MSDQQTTECRTVTVNVASAIGCRIETVDSICDGARVKVEFRPGRTIAFDSGFSSELPPRVVLEVGNASLVLSVDAWRSVIAAVQEVLPAEVTA